MKKAGQAIHGYTQAELAAFCVLHKIPRYRVKQIFRWVFQRDATGFDAMTDIPIALRRLLDKAFCVCLPTPVRVQRSVDQTVKFLLRLRDNSCIETVAIPTAKRLTGCISTQVGCKYACVFCASGTQGFFRNLCAAEIVQQALFLRRKNHTKPLTHLVFMGTGEPFDNYDNLIKAIRIINDPQGLHIGARRMTISTSGVVPGIERLSTEGLQVELSVSLHAADNRLRSALMPINTKYPLPLLMRACRRYFKATNRQITFEYLLIDGVNADTRAADTLARVLKGLDAKVNLIPYNPITAYCAQPANTVLTKRFKDILTKKGIVVTRRVPRGSDIEAACGQLRLKLQE